MAEIFFFILKVAIAVAVFALLMRVGMLMIGGLARKHGPPPAGELRKVNLRYRCSICLTEVKMVQASEELPMAPRHCQEDMDLVAGPYD